MTVCPHSRCGAAPRHPGGWCAACWRELEPRPAEFWREYVDYAITTANRLTLQRTVAEVNATIREMRQEPGGGAPLREKRRLYRYGRSRRWVWREEQMGFVAPEFDLD